MTPQSLQRACDWYFFSLAAVLPSSTPDTVGDSDFGYFGAHQLQGYPACMCPFPTLQVRGCPPTSVERNGRHWRISIQRDGARVARRWRPDDHGNVQRVD